MVEALRGARVLYASAHDEYATRGVYPLGRPADNGPRGQRGLARPSKAGLTCEPGTSRSGSGAREEHGKPGATEDRSLDTLRDPLDGAPRSLPERGHTWATNEREGKTVDG